MFSTSRPTAALLAIAMLLTGLLAVAAPPAEAQLPECPVPAVDPPEIPAPVPGADFGEDPLMTPIGTFGRGVDVFDSAAAEIVAHHAPTQRLFVVNAAQAVIDVLDISDPSDPTFVTCLDLGGGEGAASSVVVVGDLALAGLIAADKSEPGSLVIFDAGTLEELARVEVGAVADNVAISPDGSLALVANEAEIPDDFDGDFTTIPEGSVSVVPLDDPAGLEQADVQLVAFDGLEDLKDPTTGQARPGPLTLNEGTEDEVEIIGQIRLNALFPTVAQDMEPEFIQVAPDGGEAYVALQENNAIAVIDLTGAEARLDRIFGLELVDHSAEGSGIATNDGSGTIVDPETEEADPTDPAFEEADFAAPEATGLSQWPVLGIPMPDGIAVTEADGATYVLTAEEGDSREWGGDDTNPLFSVECEVILCDFGRLRGSTNPDNAAGFGIQEPFIVDICADDDDSATHKGFDIEALRTNDGGADALTAAGRLNITLTDGLRYDEAGEAVCREDITALGTRGFGVFDVATGERVFHSGDDFEQITLEANPRYFDSNHTEASFKTRADDKGPEPEDVRVATIRGTTLAFIGLERVGGVMVYDITDPTVPTFLEYLNNRDFDTQFEVQGGVGGEAWGPLVGDLGSEGQLLIDECDSPTGEWLYVAANEVSGTTTIWQVDADRIGPAADCPEPVIVTAGGADRIETAVLLSQEAFPDGASTAIVARADVYADALAAAPLAATLGGPVLLTNTDAPSQLLLAELDRLGAEDVSVVGGSAAVSPAAAGAISEAGVNVTRLEGPTRFDTAVAIAEAVAAIRPVTTGIVVQGDSADPLRGWPDALCGGPLAAATGGVIVPVLTDLVPDPIAGYLQGSALDLTVLGGEAAVSETVGTDLDAARIAGSNRYATCAAAAGAALDAGATADRAWVATGGGFADALGAGAAAAANGEVLLLVEGQATEQPDQDPLALLAERGTSQVVVAGGDAAVGAAALAALAEALGG